MAAPPEVARRNSPVHLAPSRPGPLLLPLGDLEGPEYHRQSETLATAWRRRGAAVEIHDLAGQDHFSIVSQLLDPRSELSHLVLPQMGLA